MAKTIKIKVRDMTAKELEALELRPNAWSHFERAVDAVAKSPPQHRKKKSSAGKKRRKAKKR